MKVIFSTGSITKNLPKRSFEEILKETLNPLVPPITLKSFLLVTGFFMFATSIRWLLKTYIKTEFDEVESRKMIHICKFCQIIEESKRKPGILLYEDDKIVAFKDIRPQGKLHYLIVPKEHIKNMATIKAT